MIGFFGFGYAYPVSFCEIQIHFLVGKPGEDKGHVGMAQMIFQRLEAEIFEQNPKAVGGKLPDAGFFYGV